MRLAVLSDIHANAAALEAVLMDAEQSRVDGHLVLGDVVDFGPDPAAVVARVRELGCPVVRGNHDTLDERSTVPALEETRLFTLGTLAREQLTWLASLPAECDLALDRCRVWAHHGSPGSLTRPILPTTEESTVLSWVGAHSFNVLCCGHSHVQWMRRFGARTVVNAGSVGMPFAAPAGTGPPVIFPWAEYVILQLDPAGIRVDFRRVPYDFLRLEASYRASGIQHAEELLGAWERCQGCPESSPAGV